MTKCVLQLVIEKYCHDLCMAFESGRAESTLQIAMHVIDVKAFPRFEDWWLKCDRSDGSLTRIHAKPRRTMFTPIGVKGGPIQESAIGQYRVTRGKWMSTGECFAVMDNWKNPKWAHRDLGELWVGETAFVKDTPIEELSRSANISDAPHCCFSKALIR